MKKIKIFIASSAELNEDKQMFDLYFSDKNKLYRDRNRLRPAYVDGLQQFAE